MGPPCVIFATTVSAGGGVIGDEVTCLLPPPSRQNLSSVLVMTFPSPILHFQDAKGAPMMGGILEPKQQLLPGGRQVSARDSCSRSPPQTHSSAQRVPVPGAVVDTTAPPCIIGTVWLLGATSRLLPSPG